MFGQKNQELEDNINTFFLKDNTHKRYDALSNMAKLCKVFSQLTCIEENILKVINVFYILHPRL